MPDLSRSSSDIETMRMMLSRAGIAFNEHTDYNYQGTTGRTSLEVDTPDGWVLGGYVAVLGFDAQGSLVEIGCAV